MNIFEANLADIESRHHNRSRKFLIGGLTLLALSLIILALDVLLPTDKVTYEVSQRQEFTTLVTEEAKVVTVDEIIFTGNDFRNLWRLVELKNVEPRDIDYPITNSAKADEYIRKQGEERGYERQTVASGNLQQLLCCSAQSPTISAWQDMYQAALDDTVALTISSAYRNQADQAAIFSDFLRANSGFNPTPEQIIDGAVDDSLQRTLERVAPPGYSKHHTGYTLDICDAVRNACATRFANTPGEQWLRENNYQNAKSFGFIPSYPPGVENQGPNPEPWEYVWVGKENLTLERYVELYNET